MKSYQSTIKYKKEFDLSKFYSQENHIDEKNNKKENAPPDLEDIFYRLKNKLFSKNKNFKDGKNQNFIKYSKRFLNFIFFGFLFIWAISGFYTIKEAERGVITRFGKFHHIVRPGLNWKPNFIDTLNTVNVETVRELAASGVMLTSDENVVSVEMNVQYRITHPELYLFSVTNADDSLRQATDSALRGVIGRSTMDRILTEGRTVIRTDTQKELEETIKPYKMGIALLDVNFQAARPPEEVKAAFDDAIAARENREQYVREAEAYANEVQPKANGQAQRIIEEARAYKTRVILEAQGEVERFNKLLPEYQSFPNITKNRLYLETLEEVLQNTHKVLIHEKGNQILIVPTNHFSEPKLDSEKNQKSDNGYNEKNYKNRNLKTSKIDDIVIDERLVNTKRSDLIREGRK